MPTSDLRTKAIVLHRTKYRETDRILNLLTPEGKKSVIAHGVRKEKSKLAGAIEMFCVSDVTIHYRHNQSEQQDRLGILTSAKMSEFYSGILNDLDRLELASTIIRTLNRISDQVDSPEFFSLAQQSFTALGRQDSVAVNIRLVESWFMINILRLSGEELNFHLDTHGEPLHSDQAYVWDSLERAFAPQSQGYISQNHIKLLRLMSSSPLALVAKVQGVEELLFDIEPIIKS